MDVRRSIYCYGFKFCVHKITNIYGACRIWQIFTDINIISIIVNRIIWACSTRIC